jgi:hypothetical protein
VQAYCFKEIKQDKGVCFGIASIVPRTFLEGPAAKLREPELISLGRMLCFSFPRRPDPGLRFPGYRAATGKYKGSKLAAVLKAAAAFNFRENTNHLLGGRQDDFEGRKN